MPVKVIPSSFTTREFAEDEIWVKLDIVAIAQCAVMGLLKYVKLCIVHSICCKEVMRPIG
jgi:hypothetical protein